MQFLILGWLVLELTDSAARMGFMIFLYGMPTLGFVLFGGAFADRFDRRGLLMLTQALVALLVLGIAVLETAGLVALVAHLRGGFRPRHPPGHQHPRPGWPSSATWWTATT